MTSEDVVQEWLALAREDLLAAERVFDLRGVAAFHLQQAAEKALKAQLIRLAIRPPRSHDISQLRSLAGSSLEWTADASLLSELTLWNAAFRYPDAGPSDQPTADRLTEVAGWVRSLLAEIGGA